MNGQIPASAPRDQTKGQNDTRATFVRSHSTSLPASLGPAGNNTPRRNRASQSYKSCAGAHWSRVAFRTDTAGGFQGVQDRSQGAEDPAKHRCGPSPFRKFLGPKTVVKTSPGHDQPPSLRRPPACSPMLSPAHATVKADPARRRFVREYEPALCRLCIERGRRSLPITPR